MRLTPRRTLLAAGIVALVLLLCLFRFRDAVLWHLGDMLVKSEAPQKSDMVEVLGGDYLGNRILKACSLIQQGFAPQAILTGEGGFYGVHEGEIELDFAARRGCRKEALTVFPYASLSTVDEVEHLVPELRRRGVHKLLVVTSPGHTGRAARVFQRFAPEIEVRMIASRDPFWNNGYWWKIREGRKRWLLEVTKRVADFFGI